VATPLETAVARRDEILSLLTTVPVTGSFSDQGRSATYDRGGLLAELKYLQELIVTLSGPFAVASRHKA
jgi:hypothetical protein